MLLATNIPTIDLRKRYAGLINYLGVLCHNYTVIDSVGLEFKRSRDWNPRYALLAPKRCKLLQIPSFKHADKITWDRDDYADMDLAGLLFPESIKRRREIDDFFNEMGFGRRRRW